MKNVSSFFFLLITVSLVSCVNRIAIPDDEESKLYISLEMLTKENTIVADFKTSNNLNGSYPITTPSKGIITIEEVKTATIDFDNEITLEWDEVSQKYISNNTSTFLKRGKRYILTAELEDSDIKSISAETQVPNYIDIEESELISERIVTDAEGNDFWESTVGITFVEGTGYLDRYAHLIINGKATKRNISDGDTSYVYESEEEPFLMTSINVGASAITDIDHRDGVLINMSKLENNYIEVVLRSVFPITDPNHVTDFLYTDIFAVTEDHYKYHKSLHNINKNKGNIFDEHALYLSNVENGLGLFSSCTFKPVMLKLR